MSEGTDITPNLDSLLNIQAHLNNPDFNLYAFMDLVVEYTMRLTPATGAVIELVDGSDMVYRSAAGSVKTHIGLRLPMANSITGLCVISKTILLSDDTDHDPRVNHDACKKIGARSMVVAPLFHHEKCVGVLKIVSDQPQVFNDTHVKTLQLLSGFVATGIASEMLRECRDFF